MDHTFHTPPKTINVQIKLRNKLNKQPKRVNDRFLIDNVHKHTSSTYQL